MKIHQWLAAFLLALAPSLLMAQEPAGKKSEPAEQAPDFSPADFTYADDEIIKVLLKRIKANPSDDVSLYRLGEIYEKKAGQTGDLTYFAKAEACLRKSLELFPQGHRAKVSLAAVLCAQHKFTEGLKLAREALAVKPKDVDALATAGDALLETGRYDEAETAFNQLQKLSQAPPVLSRLASLAEFKGDTEKALKLMGNAAADILKAGGAAGGAGWYQARLGDIALVAGRIDQAEEYYKSVPKNIDAFHDATAGLGRIKAMKGDLKGAITQYEKAVAIGPDAHMLAALGDLYVATGQTEKADPLFQKFLAITANKGEYLRERANFLSNHERDVAAALSLAELDLQQRKDIYGYDALAWALLKNDKPELAAEAMKQALKLGTIDAMLQYHAGMIEAKLGHREQAKAYLEACMKINPNFSLLHSENAKKALASLK